MADSANYRHSMEGNVSKEFLNSALTQRSHSSDVRGGNWQHKQTTKRSGLLLCYCVAVTGIWDFFSCYYIGVGRRVCYAVTVTPHSISLHREVKHRAFSLYGGRRLTPFRGYVAVPK